MAYDPNRLMGLDALSPTIGAYKQFVERQNNTDDANVVPFLVSRGEPQLAGLIAKKMRVENAAKSQQALAQQPPAAPPTVADQYNMAAQQQAQQAMAAQMAQMQQARMAQAAPGLAGMPNPAMEQANFAGGGMVALAGGGDVQGFAGPEGSLVGDPFSTLGALESGTASPYDYKSLWGKANRTMEEEAALIKGIAAKRRADEAAARAAGNTAAAETAASEAAAAESWLAREFTTFPTFSKVGKALPGIASGARGLAGGAMRMFGKEALPVNEAVGIWNMAHSDPESLQATSRLAQWGLMNVDPNDKVKTGFAVGLGALESALPTSWFYQTPADKARARTEEAAKPGVVTTLTPEETNVAQARSALVKQYGPNSRQVQDFDAKYREIKGITAPETKPPASAAGIGSLAKPSSKGTAGATGAATSAAKATRAPATSEYTSPYKAMAEKQLESEESYQKKQAEQSKKLGAGKAADEFEKIIDKFKARYEGEGADKSNLQQAIVQFGAALMAGKGGFSEALGQAAQTGVSGYYAGKKENEKAAMDLAKSTFELHQARENMAISDAEKGSAKYERDRKRVEDAEDKQADAIFQMNKLTTELASHEKIANEANARLEKIAAMNLGPKQDALDAKDIQTRIYALKANADIYNKILANPMSTDAQKTKAQQELNKISEEYTRLSKMSGGGAGAAGTAVDFNSLK